MIAKMHASCLWWVRAAYRANVPEIAQDVTPASILRAAIRKLTKRWTTKFDAAATKLGDWFARAAQNRSTDALKKILKDAGITIEFQITPAMKDIAQATVTQSVGLIRSIPQKYLGDVEGMVMRSVQTGRDLGALTKDLKEAYGIADRKAAFIAKSQNNIATAAFTRARALEIGLKTAVWLHSHGGVKPRKSHQEMDGKEYEISKGMWDKDAREWIWPGTLINCRCLQKVVAPGFS